MIKDIYFECEHCGGNYFSARLEQKTHSWLTHNSSYILFMTCEACKKIHRLEIHPKQVDRGPMAPCVGLK